MGENTAIEWATHTFNPWTGCQRVSPGCDHCYAEAQAKRNTSTFGGWGAHAERKRTSETYWRQPLKWNSEARKAGIRPRVFCASMADVFDNQVPEDWRADLWTLIAQTSHLDWLLLTKRPQNIAKMLPVTDSKLPGYRPWNIRWPEGWPNVWLGTTVENQAEADRRIPHLLAVPAAKRFLSCEPLLGAVDLTRICIVPQAPRSIRAGIHLDALGGRYCESGMPYVGEWDVNQPYPKDAVQRRIDWVICGGESGPGARPMHPDWARSLRDQCASAGVPFFFKQWGEWTPGENALATPARSQDGATWFDGRWSIRRWTPGEMDGLHCDDEPEVWRVGKKAAGRLLDGAQHDGVPA